METATLIELLRKMGHDMRVPLNTLISTTDMLVEGIYDPLTPKQEKAALRLKRSNHRLLAMLDDFVTYVKADVHDLALSPSPFDPRIQLETWCDSVRPNLDEKGLKLDLTTSESVPPTLLGDEAALQRIVMALLWNAIAYTQQGEIHVRSDWSSDNGWIITVQDTGNGISDSDQPHIFEPFWRGEERPLLSTAGAGLGLPLSRALAKLMGGNLLLDQTTAQGSSFCVQLPLTQVE